ncbi:hypothetical protein GALL_179110 [mine drainage metagenome]|uniref:Dicarboxylate transport domain-containing protein n=1 Tax=mine drainage metagenome TaxID=410659 RepID=A0A1J5RWB0_9ZZZZ
MLRITIIACLLSISNAAFALSSITIKADTIESDVVIVRKAALVIDLHANPIIVLAAEIKPSADNNWMQAKLSCNVPRNLNDGTWSCAHGLVQAERIKLPFSLNVLPQSKGFSADLSVQEASFSDEAGLHAAEKLSGNLQLNVTKDGNGWRWHNVLNWTGGEMFWQPFYVANGGHQFIASGVFEDGIITFDSANINIKDVGQLSFDGQMRLKDYSLIRLNADLPNLELSAAYPLIFKPLLEKTAFNNIDVAGKAALKVTIRDAELQMFDLHLNDVDISDKNNKFSFYKVNANIPWSYDDARTVSLAYMSGSLLNLPLGKTSISAEVNRYSLTSPNVTLPILDGALQLSDVSAARIGGNWHWHLGAKLAPISMPDFSLALKLPRMEGKASAEIPQVTYTHGMLTTDGQMVFNVFSGKATVSNLVMQDPLGTVPKLNLDMSFRYLDLGDLTRTFSFGAIEGKLDGDVGNLQMQNWKPVNFDAKIESSPGKYPKKISQRAVENISALGGAGAAAAIQRSFLRFFKQFNYAKIGLSCKLRNDVCQMSGVESTAGGYVIVKGSGIPAITVLGYNQTVSWSDLLGRIKRVIDGNTKAVIQ